MTTSRVLPRAAALLTAGAGALHLGVAGSHFVQWWAAGLFFLATAAGQGAWALAAWTMPPVRRLLGAGAALNTTLVGVWLLSRTAGLPLGPGAGVPEPVGAADLITVAMEGLATVAISVQARAPAAAVRLVGSSARRVTLLGAGVAAAVLVASGIALAATAPEHAPDTSTATPEQTVAAEDLLADAIAGTTAYRELAAARAAGYDVQSAWDRHTALLARLGRSPSPDRVQLVHMPNRAFRADGRILEPNRPETLVFARTADGEFVLVGVMFTAERRQPPVSYQPYLRWHTHSFCRGGGLARAKPVDGVCADGTVLTESGAMTHLWFVDQKDLAHAYAMRPPREQMRAYQESLARG